MTNPWSERAGDWADVMEGWNGWGVPLYRRVLRSAPVEEGTRVLDVGCGAGRFCRMAADRGAVVAGLDATPEFVEIARSRVRGADLRVGDMRSLPWEEDAFDLVTGFNSFFIAGDMVGALREAARVTRPGGRVATTVFGRPDRCSSTAIFGAAMGLMPASPEQEDEEAGPALHEDGVLDSVAREAGLEPVDGGYHEFEEVYPDLETVLRGMLAAPPFRRAAAVAGEEELRRTVSQAMSPFRGEDGGYRLKEEARFVVAVA
jgi:SAM-dependent methyltransferase